MASDQTFVNYVVAQIEGAGIITAKKMFGEYGLYADDKLFGLICDNKLFIKQTAQGRAFIGNVTEAPPYKGAKPSFLIEEKLEDKQWLGKLVKLTVDNLSAQPSKKRNNKI